MSEIEEEEDVVRKDHCKDHCNLAGHKALLLLEEARLLKYD